MTGLVIAVNKGGIPYAEDSLAVLQDFFDYNDTKLVIITKDLPQNKYRAHPSWLKMFCHEIIEDDMVLCWDLDLLPVKRYKIEDFIQNRRKLNIGIETGLLYGFGMEQFGPKFKYNCGFMGVPRYLKQAFLNIYEYHGMETHRLAWEQLYVNDFICDMNVDINIIRPEYNCSLNLNREFLPYTCNAHYTYGVMDVNERAKMIKQHRKDYFEKI